MAFPYENSASGFLSDRWDKQTYLFLANFIRTLHIYPRAEPDEHGIYEITFNPDGTEARIPIPDFSVGASEAYSSYFKLYDASTETHCMIGVTDGGWIGDGSPTNCGSVKVNGTYVAIESFVSESIEQDGTYWVWLQSWIDPVDGAKAAIIVGSYNSSRPPGDGHGSLAYANQLLGRATVVDLKITEINQDYLRGGEHTEYLWAYCFEEA